MDCEQKYNAALERARGLLDGMEEDGYFATLEDIKQIFPELQESEDESIREMCMRYLDREYQRCPSDRKNIEKCITWLEKQGEKNINHIGIKEKAHQIAWETSKDYDPLLSKESWCEMAALDMASWLEKQGKQTHAELCQSEVTKTSGQELEPKFKVGDWCIDNEDDTIFQIAKVLDNTYTYMTNEGKEYSCTHYSLENDARLWAIQDAKNGDVLAYKDEISLYKHDIKNCTKQETTFGGFVYHCCYDGKRFITNSLYSLTEQDKTDIHPATKEQRDALIKAMANAGYTFDFEKKELKKIEPKTLDPEKVIEWMKTHGNLVPIVTIKINEVITKFKKDFGLC